MTTTIIGRKVRVKIQNPAEYARDAAARLNGVVGTVEEHAEDFKSAGASAVKYDKFLVHFDEPVEGWWGKPITSFWFPRADLELA